MRRHDVRHRVASRQGKSVLWFSSCCFPPIGVGRTAGFYAAQRAPFILSAGFRTSAPTTPAKYLKDGVREFRGFTNNDGEHGRYAAVIASDGGRSLVAIFTRSAREAAFI